MSVDRMYQTYYGVYLNHWSDTWGGNTYNEMLVKEYPNEYLSTTSVSIVSDITFMYPSLYKNKYYLDGQMEGHFTIYNQSSTTSYYVSSYTVELKKTNDVASNETVLGTYSNTISSNNTVPPEDYLTLPIYMNIEKQIVNPNERLLLNITFTETGGTYTYVGFSHWNDSSIPDIKIKVPYAYTG